MLTNLFGKAAGKGKKGKSKPKGTAQNSYMGGMKKGGKVRKTGVYTLHKGERVESVCRKKVGKSRRAHGRTLHHSQKRTKKRSYKRA